MNWIMWGGITAAIVLLALVAPFLRELARPKVGAVQRDGAEGAFATLSQGVTHYRWIGPVRGPVVVMIHGIATPMEGMEPLAEGLGSLGYRVLTYDLYGRGLSDAPEGRQDRVFFMRQLEDLLNHLGIEQELTLCGYSMGGAIATAYAAEHAYRVNRLILVASTGVMIRENGFTKFTKRRRIIGSWLHALAARNRINKTIPLDDQRPAVSRVLVAQRQELKRRGFLPSLLSSQRGMASEMQEKEHRALGRSGVPVIAIWAEKDAEVPSEAVTVLARWNRRARQQVIAGASHALPYTHGEEVLSAIRQGLRVD